MTASSPPRIFDVADDVYGLRLGHDDTLSSFLVVDREPTLVDAATASSVDDIVEAMETLGVEPTDLSNVIVSHIHLDHSGAAAGLAERTDDLDVYVHESTAHHLVDPERLIESTKRVLGDEFEKMGAPDPLPEEHVEPVLDGGLTLDTGEHSLNIVHTPGHSPDHLSVVDSVSGAAFANEAVGRYYPRADCWVPPVTLPGFDAEAVSESIESLRATDPDVVGLSHVGTVDPVDVWERATDRLEEFTDRIPAWYEETGDVGRTVARVRERLLTLDDEYPENIVATQADICTRGVLDHFDLP